MKRLFISAGHGGKDPGAVANHRTEHQMVAKLSKSLVKKLRDSGAEAVQVPIGLSLQERINWVNSNTNASDFLLELHMNAASSPAATGCEGYFFTGSDLAEKVCLQFMNTYSNNISLKLRGVAGDTTTRHGRLGIIRFTPPLALLVECGFITNMRDVETVELEGVDALYESCMELLGLQIPKVNVSPFAEVAVNKAIDKKIAVYWDNPHEIVSTSVVEHVFKNAGIISTVTGQGLTKERLMVVLDRLRLKTDGEKSLLD